MKYLIAKEYVWKEVGGQVVLLSLDTGRYYTLNSTGSLIWRGLMENRSPEQIADQLFSEFKVERGTAQSDVSEMVQGFLTRKMIVRERSS